MESCRLWANRESFQTRITPKGDPATVQGVATTLAPCAPAYGKMGGDRSTSIDFVDRTNTPKWPYCGTKRRWIHYSSPNSGHPKQHPDVRPRLMHWSSLWPSSSILTCAGRVSETAIQTDAGWEMTIKKSIQKLPPLPHGFEYRLALRGAVTPKELKGTPRHRWFYFPHSYAPRLIHEVLDRWNAQEGARLMDPYVGAGTTSVVGRERGMHAVGWDLSPLAVLVSKVKTRPYNHRVVNRAFRQVLSERQSNHTSQSESQSPRLLKAFSPEELSQLLLLRQSINKQAGSLRDFLMVGLLTTAARFSRAVPDGGWFRWIEKDDESRKVLPAFEERVLEMLADLQSDVVVSNWGSTDMRLADSRQLRLVKKKADLLITSPPYPNRHDYSRIFHVELLLLGQSEKEITHLRKHSIRSHVEAATPRYGGGTPRGFQKPESLIKVLDALKNNADKRVQRMIEGYFPDLFRTLVASYHALAERGKAAFVVGNVRHGGILVPVDEILVEIAQQAGFIHDGTWVVRLRGNSAQQMGQFGRKPSRESIVFLTKSPP